MVNTGNKIYRKLVKVSNDTANSPLDENNELCDVTGLPQSVTDNVPSNPNYIPPFEDLNSCPISSHK